MTEGPQHAARGRRNLRRRLSRWHEETGPRRLLFSGRTTEILLSFLLGLGSLVQVRIVGYLGLTELLLAGLLPYYLLNHWTTIARSRLYPIVLLSMGWLVSALVTDLWRHTELADLLRGSAAIVLWISCLVGMYCHLRGNPDRIRWFSLGVAISAVICLYVLQPGYLVGRQELNPDEGIVSFRTGYGYALSMFVLAAAAFYYRGWAVLMVATCLAFSGACFLLGARSLGGSFLLGSAATMVVRRWLWHPVKPGDARRLLARRMLALMGILLLGVAGSYYGYREAASRGFLGETEKERFREQSDSRIGVMAGRSEFVSGFLAVMDSPVLGHGSWAKDTGGYLQRTADLLGVEVHDSILARANDMYIPGHSYIWNSWIWHGVLGALLWIYVLWFLIRFLFTSILSHPEYLLFNLIVLFGSIWDILFSPFGMRPVKAAYVCFFVIMYQTDIRSRRPSRSYRRRERRGALQPQSSSAVE